MFKSFFLIFVIIFSNTALCAVKERDVKKYVNSYIFEKKYTQIDLKKIPRTHPDFPVYAVLKALKFERQSKFKDVIDILEPVRTQVNYSGIESGNSTNRKLVVGTYEGFRIWRELSYLLTGRAYYALGLNRLAEESFKGIPKESAYYNISLLNQFWNSIALDNKESALSFAEKIDKLSFQNSQLISEKQLVEAYALSIQKKYLLAQKTALSVINTKDTSHEIRLAAFKLYAESGFMYWHVNNTSIEFDEGIQILKSVINISQRIPKKMCDHECSFFISEAWWNLASLYRISDPVKNQKVINDALKNADKNLNRYVNKSFSKKATELSEDAYFLSIVISWENKDYKNAIKKSNAFPGLFPVGRYREDVYQMLGDYYYEKKDFKKSLDSYRKLVEIGSHDKTTYATYKAAWSFYNLDKKWAALRQLELLIQAKISLEGQSKDQLGILKESKRDMLLFMAELMSFTDAKNELAFVFKDDEKRILTGLNDLAFAYKKIGRFAESSKAFSYLINDYIKDNNDSEPFTWLKELLDNNVRSRKFQDVYKNLLSYYPKLLKAVDGETKSKDDFFNYTSSIVLVIHKEAKKTEDPQTWSVLDSLYNYIGSSFYDKCTFSFLYFGAQRFEQLEQFETSIKWYQMGSTKKHELSSDSAVSALRVAKTIYDRHSIQKDVDPKESALVASVSKWFIDGFNSYPQRHIADDMYLNQMFVLDTYSKSIDHILNIFENDGVTEKSKFKLKVVQNQLYSRNLWEDSYKLLEKIYSMQSITNQKYRSVIKSSMQESAFQTGFSIKDDEKSLGWYERAIELNSSVGISLKAWNNLFIILSKKKDFELIDSRYSSFSSFISKNNIELQEDFNTIFETSLLVSKAYYDNLKIVKSLQIELAAKKFNGSITSTDKNRILELLSRFNVSEGNEFLTNKIKTTKSSIAIDILIKKGLGSTLSKSSIKKLNNNIVNLINLYFISKDENSLDWVSSKVTNKPEFTSVNYDLEKLNDSSYIAEEVDLTSLEKGKENELVAVVKKLDNDLALKIKDIKSQMVKSSFYQQVNFLCKVPDLKKSYIDQLEFIAEFSDKYYADWKEFSKTIENKVENASNIMKSDIKSCDDGVAQLSFYSPIYKDRELLFFDYRSYTVDKSQDDLEFIYATINSGEKSELEKHMYLLKNNAEVLETLVYSKATKDQLSIMYALERIKHLDYFNAYSLLKSVKTELDHKNLLIAYILKENRGNFSEYLDLVVTDNLGPLYKSLYEVLDD